MPKSIKNTEINPTRYGSVQQELQLDDIQLLLERIAKNDKSGFTQLFSQLKDVNFVDDTGMSLLACASFKGNKEAVQILLDMGADVHLNQHGADYTPLHFAALSGSTDVCRQLLDAGINPSSINSVSRTASQMAAFVGNHACVETINNYITRSGLEYYTQAHGQQTEPLIPPALLSAFHTFVIEINLHPVRIALNAQSSYSKSSQLDDIQLLLERIAKNDKSGFTQLFSQLKDVNFVDDTGMSLLACASFKGNKEAVQILLDMRVPPAAGCRHQSEQHQQRLAHRLTDGRLRGNHACVETINNYITRSGLEYYTQAHGQQTEPLIPPALLSAFHTFVIEINLHPVRIALNAQSLGLLRILSNLRKTLALMCEKEMQKTHDMNELLAFKFHYQGWIVAELIRCEEQFKAQHKEKTGGGEPEVNKNDFIELFVKRVLKENEQGQLDYVEYTLRECAREFPVRECTIFRQIATQFGGKDAPPALVILRNAINGMRGFVDETSYCSTCGQEKPDKKCSKCKAVQYCDRECQRLHWFMHKKSCARLLAASLAGATTQVQSKGPIDTSELQEQLSKLSA
ncbi:ankyrin repeat and MYND domain-containing protein 2-like [Drosophila miranda]|uniref:ankyrin repeat and MYND domain-containing protein 2-like n=1 Tax=Drosophila miranda TaxID=7229 RepID=UPI00143F5698|nr:ankyrin repeat and MYND domain-containing protein 2-like [Drosophila miranda]